ncbi:MAG: von Willebrand factor type A domain-containing protein [Bacteroidota bacterium]
MNFIGSSLQAQTAKLEGTLYSQDSVAQADFKVQLFAQSYLLSESKTDISGKFSLSNLTISKGRIVVHKLGVRKEFLFALNGISSDSTFRLAFYLDESAARLDEIKTSFQFGQAFDWRPESENTISKDEKIDYQQFLPPRSAKSGEASLNPVIILAERPFEGGNPTVGTITNREIQNIPGQLSTTPSIVPTPDLSETNYLGIRPRPPLPDLKNRKPDHSSEDTRNNWNHYSAYQPRFASSFTVIPPPIIEHDRKPVRQQPLSTFSVDVDNASYTQLRASIQEYRLPYPFSIRTEELINYFDYQYPEPEGPHPIAMQTEVSPCPWNQANQIVRISLKAKDSLENTMPAGNFVFLIDVSGSMNPAYNLPLLKHGLKKMVTKLKPEDKVAFVVYAGASRVVLAPTPGSEKATILEAINKLSTGGGTNGSEGIKTAYQLAEEAFLEEGNNRVILCTDGDFNLGITNTEELVKLIKTEREKGIYLSALRVGHFHGNDYMMEEISNHGNGVYFYLDTKAEAERVLVDNFLGTFLTVAKDVKIQVEFNPSKVNSYRLIGYEDRILSNADFDQDSVDAGDMGVGHRVTALYEITPYTKPADVLASNYAGDELLRYADAEMQNSVELLTVKFRYKHPTEDSSQLIQQSLNASITPWERCSADHRWAAVVAEFGMLLRDSYYVHHSTFEQAIGRAYSAANEDTERLAFIEMMIKAKEIKEKLYQP